MYRTVVIARDEARWGQIWKYFTSGHGQGKFSVGRSRFASYPWLELEDCFQAARLYDLKSLMAAVVLVAPNKRQSCCIDTALIETFWGKLQDYIIRLRLSNGYVAILAVRRFVGIFFFSLLLLFVGPVEVAGFNKNLAPCSTHA